MRPSTDIWDSRKFNHRSAWVLSPAVVSLTLLCSHPIWGTSVLDLYFGNSNAATSQIFLLLNDWRTRSEQKKATFRSSFSVMSRYSAKSVSLRLFHLAPTASQLHTRSRSSKFSNDRYELYSSMAIRTINISKSSIRLKDTRPTAPNVILCVCRVVRRDTPRNVYLP